VTARSPSPGSEGRTYAAFISYSHADREIAHWLHEAVERYRIPASLRRTGVPPRITPVFLDTVELHAGADLDADVGSALERSDALIVVCSPQAAASPRVDFEIREFRRLHPGRPVLAVLAAGRPNAIARGLDPALECLPAGLLPGSSHGPLAADLRQDDSDRREALLKVAAGLLGVSLDTLRARDSQRSRRRAAAIVAALSAVAVVMAGLAAYGQYERQLAQHARALADREAASAEDVTRSLIAVFGEADPALAKDHETTLREVLDAGAAHIAGDSEMPLPVRARLLRAIGVVYDARGWYDEADRLLSKSVEDLDPRDPAMAVEHARSQVAYAHLLANRRDPRAESLYRAALPVLDADPRLAIDQIEARALLGYVLWAGARYSEATPLLESALARLSRDRPEDISLRAELLQTTGRVVRDSGDRLRALPYFKESSELSRQLRGESYYWYASAVFDLGNTNLLLGRYDEAAAELNRAITIFEQALGPQHAFIATPLQSRARVHYDRGELAAARADLVRALAIHDSSGNALSVDAARAKAYLARVDFEQHQPDEAYLAMGEVLSVERDRMGEESAEYAQMLRWKALLLIRGGRWSEAAPLLARAAEIAERKEASNQPRLLIAREETALAYCLAQRREDARRALGQARALDHTQVAPWTAWTEDAINAACGAGDATVRRAAWEAARSKVAAQLGPGAPLMQVLGELPAPHI
jgi:tetratricopeptide (TPR) repeat protein